LILVLVIVWRLNARRAAQVFSRSEDYHESQTDLHQRYEDWISISRIAALGIDSDQLANRFEADAKAAASHAVGFSRSYAATRASYEGAVVATILVGVPVAWWLETPPALLAFGLVLLVRVLPQAAGIHNSYLGVANAEAPTRNIEDLIRELERDPARHFYDGTSLQWQCLELANVSVGDQLRSQGDEPILQNVSLTLDHGEWLALHGPTGAGKTTLADVMLMLLRPGAGVIRIDGAEVDEETASRWREQSAYVPQDVVLFDASIRENLTLCAPETSDAVLEAALRRSAAEFVVDRLPEGLSTRAGPGGRWLSGGERQRIGIARALLKKPGFLVLDEPTAALDAGTQAKLMQALSELEHTMSVLLITHRPELLELADRVIELEDGTISD
jgi:ATP-binding cassette subfamily C protein